MARPESLTVPNLLTLLRLVLVPVFLVLLWMGKPSWALACFAGAAITDGLDGLLARVLDQRSPLGALMDPVADKVLLFAALTALVLSNHLPAWLWTGVVMRDLFLTGVAWTVRRRHLRIDVTPSRVGKYATFSLSLLIVLVLLNEVAPGAAGLHAYTRVFTLLAGLAVVLSAVQYVGRFGRLLWNPPPPA